MDSVISEKENSSASTTPRRNPSHNRAICFGKKHIDERHTVTDQSSDETVKCNTQTRRKHVDTLKCCSGCDHDAAPLYAIYSIENSIAVIFEKIKRKKSQKGECQ